MDWNLLNIAIMVFMGIVFILALAYARALWKNGSKFLAFIALAVAVGLALGFYAIFGKRLFS